MRAIIAAALLAGIMLATAGCAAVDRVDKADSTPTDIPAAQDIDSRLGNAVKDARPGIEVDAFIRERKAILPGFAVPVTVTVRNSGDETVEYVRGSGGYTTPEAVFIDVDGLQAVLPEDHLGPVTLDFRTEELKPGEQLEFVMYVMAIEPNDSFDAYTVEMYEDSGEYAAKASWDDLRKRFPELAPATSGQYQGQAYFMYYLRNESGAADFTETPGGYASCEFTIAVS